jgi:hypothetical protein
MNPRIEKMFVDAEGRYLEATEQAAIMDYASGLEQRLAAMRAVQEHESAIVEASVAELMKNHPELRERHTQVEEKADRKSVV